MLTSDIDGQYQISGSITIDTIAGFENGGVVQRPRLLFDIPNLVDAPGPYLYLSKRPFSETQVGDLDESDGDVFVAIDDGTDGQFNVRGTFEQFLDEVDADDLLDYAGGSWIVWCRPFGVWIGGGSIAAVESLQSSVDYSAVGFRPRHLEDTKKFPS